MSKRNNYLRRRKPRLSPRIRILIVAEGKVTESDYLKGLRHRERSQLAHIEVVGLGATPKRVVEHAVEAKQKAMQEAKRQRDDNLKYDEVWCVFDCDEHPKLAEAKRQACDNGFHIAFSNPCFELWLLLHFQDQRASIHRDEVARQLKNYIQDYEKSVDFELFSSTIDLARKRAVDLTAWQIGRGCKEQNPWTTVHLLADRIGKLGKQALLRDQIAKLDSSEAS